MRVLIDVSLSPGWVRALQDAGIEAVHWSAVGSPAAPDLLIMQYAQQHGYAVMTHDLDFSSMLFNSLASRPSVIQLRAKDVHPAAVAQQVITELQMVANEIDEGALVTIDLRRTRLRLLPFRSGQ